MREEGDDLGFPAEQHACDGFSRPGSGDDNAIIDDLNGEASMPGMGEEGG
jgi:hypothetical protein